MDENKLKMLKSMDYKIDPCCALCVYGIFRDPASAWGECCLFEYDHLKHTGQNRNVSVNRYGVCPLFVPSTTCSDRLDKFEEFFNANV